MATNKSRLPSGSSMTAHPLALSIMSLCGVDPVAAVDGKAAWPEGYAPDYVDNDGGILRMRTTLDSAHDVKILFNGGEARLSARRQNLPPTAMLGLEGEPLDRIVDHVLVNGRGHKVTIAEPFEAGEEGGEGTHFLIDGEPVVFVAP